jgi:hypothetical protein
MLQDASSLSLVAHQDDITSRLAEKLASYRRRRSIQFDQLFPREGRNAINKELRK